MLPEEFTDKVLSIKNKLYRFAAQLIKSEEEAKDIVQDVMLKLWLNRQEIHRYLNFESWAMRMARNLCLDRIKAKGNNNDHLSDKMVVECSGTTPYQKAENTNQMQLIAQMMDKLPRKQQEALHLRDVEGYSYQEICEIMQVDLNQVKVNLFRARKTLRENLITLNDYGLQRDRKPA